MGKLRGAGFTLIETVVVIGMLGIVVVPLLSMFSLGLTSSYDATKLTMASFLAQEKVEEVLAAAPASRLSLHLPSVTPITGDSRFTYTRQVVVYAVGLLQVTVEIYWQESGRNRSYKVVTLVASQ